MRSLAILMVLVAGGCGGSGARVRPEAGRGAAVVADVQKAADDVCRCGDGACADEVVRGLGERLRGRDDLMLTTGEQSAMVHAVGRIDACRRRLVRRGEQAARVAERWASETCACADAACADVAARRGAAELRRYGDAEANDAEVQRIVVASRQVQSCVRAFSSSSSR